MKASESSTLETILLADDDAAVRELLELSLQSLGYRVLTADDGDVALRHLTASGCEIELLITDSLMPKLGGLELCAHLQQSHPKLKKLLISGNGELPMDNAPLDCQGIAFLKKPFSLPLLAAKVRELLDSVAS